MIIWSDEEISEFNDSWLLIANEAAANKDSEIYRRLMTLFNKESFLRWVIHFDLAFDTVDSIRFRDMMLHAHDSLSDFGRLQTDETIKWSVMDNYKAYNGIQRQPGQLLELSGLQSQDEDYRSCLISITTLNNTQVFLRFHGEG